MGGSTCYGGLGPTPTSDIQLVMSSMDSIATNVFVDLSMTVMIDSVTSFFVYPKSKIACDV